MIKEFFLNKSNKSNVLNLISMMCDPLKVFRIRVDEYDARTIIQNEKMHAMLGDIARQAKHLNQVLDLDSWKRLCVDQYRKDCIENDLPRLADYWKRQNFRIMPGLDGSSLVALGTQTRDFPKYVAAGFIEWLYAYGAKNEIVWSKPEKQFDERYAA